VVLPAFKVELSLASVAAVGETSRYRMTALGKCGVSDLCSIKSGDRSKDLIQSFFYQDSVQVQSNCSQSLLYMCQPSLASYSTCSGY